MEDELLKMQIAALKLFNARAATLDRQCDGYLHAADTITLKMSRDKDGNQQCRITGGTLKIYITVLAEL